MVESAESPTPESIARSTMGGHPVGVPDTTHYSLIHRLHEVLSRRFPGWAPVLCYLGAVLVTYMPMLVAASHDSVLRSVIGRGMRISFLDDWNIAFAFLVSFPMLVLLLATDQQVLADSLKQVQDDHVLSIPEREAKVLVSTWEHNFAIINLVSQIAAAVLAVTLGLLTLWAVTRSGGDSWIGEERHWATMAYLVSIVLMYFIIIVFVARCVAIPRFLNSVVTGKATRVSMQPFHPDRCGGLRPVGRLGLRNQYTVTVLGLNIVILAAVTLERLPPGSSAFNVVVTAALTYLVLGPVVFLGPLLPFRRCMYLEKRKAMSEVSERLRVEFERVRRQIPGGQITKTDDSLIKRLRKLGAAIDELPVWPFDAKTLRRFASAYVIPLGAALLEHLFTKLTSGALHLT